MRICRIQAVGNLSHRGTEIAEENGQNLCDLRVLVRDLCPDCALRDGTARAAWLASISCRNRDDLPSRLIWGDYDLCFPVADLHENAIRPVTGSAAA